MVGESGSAAHSSPESTPGSTLGFGPAAAHDGPSVVVEHLGKSFGALHALRDVSFEVQPGEVVALLGPNGAGKTTTVNILATLARPDRGRASVAGYDVVSEAAAVRQSIMLTGQHVALDEMLTGRENLVLFGRLQDMRASQARARADELLEKFDLEYAADRRLGTYSGGMRRRIDIACGLVIAPAVVFLDEPTTGLDPRSRQTIWDLVTEFKSLGIATLLTTQYLEEADALSDRIIVIDHGVVVAEGTADELKERTGGSYCEVVPKDPKDLPAVVAALGSLLPEQHGAALTPDSDRIVVPAPGGANTLLEALSRLSATNLELADVALRRPSLDDVFLSLTGLPTGHDTSASDGAAPGEPSDQPRRRSRRPVLRGASGRRVLSPILAGLLVGGVVAALGLTGDSDRPGTSGAEAPRADAVFSGIRGGTCLTWPKDDPGQPSVVPCTDEHVFEVADAFNVNARQAPCQPAVQRYLGGRYDPTGKYTITALWPSSATGRPSDDDQVLCGLQLLDADGQPIALRGQVAQDDQSKTWPAGTCLGIDSSTNQPTQDPVDCAAPHAVEITGTVNLGDGFSGPPPAQGEQVAFLDKACTRMATAYLSGAPLEATGLTVHYDTVSGASWLAGSRQVPCGLGATMGGDQGWAALTGTVTGEHLINGEPPSIPEMITPETESQTAENEESSEAPATTTRVPGSADEVPTSSTPTTATTVSSTPPVSETPSEALPPLPSAGASSPGSAPVTTVAPPAPVEPQPLGPRPGP